MTGPRLRSCKNYSRSSRKRLNLCKAKLGRLDIIKYRHKHTVSLLPSTTGTEAEANPGRPGPPLEQQDGEDNTEGQAEGGLDDHGGNGAVPLHNQLIN
jgi:hypothetical protein